MPLDDFQSSEQHQLSPLALKMLLAQQKPVVWMSAISLCLAILTGFAALIFLMAGFIESLVLIVTAAQTAFAAWILIKISADFNQYRLLLADLKRSPLAHIIQKIWQCKTTLWEQIAKLGWWLIIILVSNMILTSKKSNDPMQNIQNLIDFQRQNPIGIGIDTSWMRLLERQDSFVLPPNPWSKIDSFVKSQTRNR